MKLSMSISAGKVAGHRHDVEQEYREGLGNVVKDRTPLNQVLIDVPLEDAYAQEFGDALDAYNAALDAKGHSERRIDSYLDKISASKQEKASYEMVVQLGNMDTNSADVPANRLLSETIYRDFLTEMQKQLPNFRVYLAAVHVDEATPHLHVAYVPVSHGNKRGLSTKNSLRGAMREMGYTDIRDLNQRMFEILEDVSLRHGVTRVDMACSRKHLDVRDFKAMQRELQADQYPYKNDPRLVQMLTEQQDIIESMGDALEKQNAALESVEKFNSPVHPLAFRRAVEQALATFHDLYPTYKPVRERIAALKASLDAVPSLWRDRIINPISDKLRAERAGVVRDTHKEGIEPSKTPSLADEAREVRGSALALGGVGVSSPSPSHLKGGEGQVR